MKSLKISQEISLPIEAVTQTMAMLGRKGAGKTYLASMVAEQMLDAKAQVIVIDPVGNWYGLRIGADGKSKGKEIFVIGGEHGDVPLVPEAGKRIAKLLVEKQISAVLDVSGFRIGEHKRFAADFAEEFFHLKKTNKTPVHIFIEEAQKLIPQHVGADEARMVGAFEQIVRLGRNYGIGCSLISQRPQSVNKEVLSQVECLCVLQMTGPHERKALDEWVQQAGADRKLVNELPGLARGEGYVWSPGWLRVYERVHFSKKETFDTSATPEVGKKTESARISSVDVESLKADMQDIVSQAEKDNPVALRKRIAELEKAHRESPKVVGFDEKAAKPYIDRAIKLRDKEWQATWDATARTSASSTSLLMKIGNLIDAELAKKPENIQPPAVQAVERTAIPRSNGTSLTAPNYKVPTEYLAPREVSNGLSKGARAVLSYLHQVFPKGKTKSQLWITTGYSAGGGFNNCIYELTGSNSIRQQGGLYFLGDSFDPASIDPDFKISLDLWRQKLGLGARKVFDLLLESPEPMRKDELAAQTGYAIGGGFNNNIYELTGAELVVKTPDGYKVNPLALDLN